MELIPDEFLQGKNLVLWGCGTTATRLLESHPNISDHIVECVDSNTDAQGRVFFDKWIVKDPTILKRGGYRILVTTRKPQVIIDYLEELGYTVNYDYAIIPHEINPTMHLENILATVRQYTRNVLFVVHSGVPQILNPSETERLLKNYELLIKDRNEWFKSNPPHISKVHRELPYYSDKYIQNIFTLVDTIRQNGILSKSDYKNEYLNVIGGLRATTDQPSYSKHKLHMFGASHVFGY